MNAFCIFLAGLVALFTIWTVVLQIQTLLRNKKLTSHNTVIVRNWCAIGLLSLTVISVVAWLFSSVPILELGWTLVLLSIYVWLFWMRGMKHVVERTEDLNFARASGIGHGSNNYWAAIQSRERDFPDRPHRV